MAKKPTVAFLLAQHEANLARIAYLEGEVSRKERLLRTTQQFLAKAKKQAAQPAGTAPSARRAAMEAAKAEAMASGRCVTAQFN